MKNLMIVLFLLFRSAGFSQLVKCNCEAHINFDKTKDCDTLTKLFYEKITSENPECDIVKIIADSSDFFKVIAFNPITGYPYRPVWVKKSNQFETTAIANSFQSTLIVYEEPNFNSKILLYTYPLKLYKRNKKINLTITVINCQKDWIKVKVTRRKKTYIGWISKEGHCPYPCTNCC